jgi:hypothetical protein
LTGVAATSAVGTVGKDALSILAPTGVQATSAVGNVGTASLLTIPLTGVSATGQVGTVTPTQGKVADLTGVEAASAAGTVGRDALVTIGLTGVQATGQVGTVTASTTGSVTLAITGVQAQGRVGTVGVTGADVSGGGHFIPLTEKQLRDLRKQERRARKAQDDREAARLADAQSIAADIRASIDPKPLGIAPTVNPIEIAIEDDDDADLEMILLSS